MRCSSSESGTPPPLPAGQPWRLCRKVSHSLLRSTTRTGHDRANRGSGHHCSPRDRDPPGPLSIGTARPIRPEPPVLRSRSPTRRSARPGPSVARSSGPGLVARPLEPQAVGSRPGRPGRWRRRRTGARMASTAWRGVVPRPRASTSSSVSWRVASSVSPLTLTPSSRTPGVGSTARAVLRHPGDRRAGVDRRRLGRRAGDRAEVVEADLERDGRARPAARARSRRRPRRPCARSRARGVSARGDRRRNVSS